MNNMLSNLSALTPSIAGYQRAGSGQSPEPGVARSVNAPAKAEESGSTQSAASQFNVDELVDNLWSFMRGRLSQAKASGASEADMDKLWAAAEKGIKQGFGEARDVLESMGKLDNALEGKIDQAYGRLEEALANRDLNAEVTHGNSTQISQSGSRSIGIYQYEQRTFSLDVTTAEGDKVTIHVDRRTEAAAEKTSGDGWSSLSWGKVESGQFDLSIEGDLNDQEKADLKALLQEVGDLADEFYDGDLGVAFEQAQALSISGTSLASLDLSMRSVQAKGVSAYQQAGGEGQSLPRGLEPLREYARELVDAQQRWMDSLNSERGLVEALSNHPRNDGQLSSFLDSLFADHSTDDAANTENA
ncbi:hypothetical protein BGP77_04200 [Saccharospirillum sp. MSK14-1]|uniref:DUF5610 domain-containing protein n=1 Tax=Saccharospirillum sp. MSK14-1 TaxID=1897632 RepID=UPI000D3C74D5|nr:DUF5610 domain-containing protein [Saccharospirillum sp. MSK14-1]PTY36506.1 hypothetical protein BGP77_04200 [Saccharospirillum sp. MSK14-1]